MSNGYRLGSFVVLPGERRVRAEDGGDAARAALQRAVELYPNDALALSFLAFAEAANGQVAPSIEHARCALRPSPRDPRRGIMLNVVGWGQALLGDWAEGARGTRAAVEQLRQTATDYLATRLAGRTMFIDPGARRLTWTFLRIAAGLEPPEAAEALR